MRYRLDEKITIDFRKLPPTVNQLAFVVMSYTGQRLDEVTNFHIVGNDGKKQVCRFAVESVISENEGK